MIKHTLFFLLFFTFSFSQENSTKGIVKDAETKEIIPFVNVIYKDNSGNLTGTITNEDGEFSLHHIKEVEISHINYETKKVVFENKEVEIYLTPKVYILDELIISNVSGRDFLKSLIKDAKVRAVKNTKLSTYGREIVKINNQYTKYSDALMDYYIKKGNGKSVLLINQSRAIKTNLQDSTSSVLNGMNSGYNVRDYVKYAYNFDGIENLIKSKEYTFDRYLRRDASGLEYEYVKIIPNPDSDELLYEGYVIVDNKSNKIVEFKVELADSHKKNSKLKNILIAKYKLNDHAVWCKFKFTNNQYELVYYKNSFNLYIQMGKKVHDYVSTTFDLLVLDSKNDVELPEKGYSENTIFEAGTNYTQKFWKMNNIFPLKETEQRFVDSIKN
ncbi:carboxypeptidase-like regulatory domain-containing protein [Flavobacterium proteolyticum]|uniref:Carboxypeptidase-like regulatory domain-containing protein n=1 Tax=Flavobacterium proteolyticum TaxID=2911683 RepID=A0ABR9WNF7_9FLAO|nr:carboxypeptidase-like regulatory domain-containing protein [Flavobacterium proteolyticum]MBE9575303.1 carboxypeptidase-like regulatory domain-containing protein [Flavobacterium proteolyticum]